METLQPRARSHSRLSLPQREVWPIEIPHGRILPGTSAVASVSSHNVYATKPDSFLLSSVSVSTSGHVCGERFSSSGLLLAVHHGVVGYRGHSSCSVLQLPHWLDGRTFSFLHLYIDAASVAASPPSPLSRSL